MPNKAFRFSFHQTSFINPRIIQDLATWESDAGDQVIAINVLKSQDSNRYYCDVLARTNASQNPFVYTETTTVENGETNTTEFGYQYIGRTSSGIYVLLIGENDGGSGAFRSLLLVSFEYDQVMVLEQDVVSREKRLLIKKRGEFALGDRWSGDLRVEGNSIVSGSDKEQFGYNTNEMVLQVNNN